jgi:hypothetical protein
MSKREMAVFTIVQNDPWMAARWHKYYSKYFEPQDIHIMDHRINEKGCTDGLNCNIQAIDYDLSFHHDWLKQQVQNKQRELLQQYNKVLFAEIDEFVAPDPDVYVDLKDYIHQFKGGIARVRGFNVVQVGDEPRLNLESDILPQRTHWAHYRAFDKPLLVTHPIEYIPGFHTADGCGDDLIDSNLYMIHLKWVCLDYLLEKNKEICNRRWMFFDWISKMGAEHKMLEVDEVKQFIKEAMEEPVPIPDRFKHLL